MDIATQSAIDRRLARIEGQIRGLRRMVQEQDYCCDILVQVAATRSALEQVGAELAVSHVRTCILGHGTDSAHAHTKPMSQEEMVEELKTTLSRLVR